MRIALFYPRGYDSSESKSRISSLASKLPPIGLATIAAVLRDAGHTAKIFDAACYNQVPNRTWVKKILDFKPDFVGFSTVTSSFLDAYDVCHGVKEVDNTILTTFGGVHVSWGREKILTQFPAIDFVIAGEGEYAFLDLVNNKTPQKIAGLYYRDGTSIKQGPLQEKNNLCNMDDLPFPAYELADGFPKQYAMPLFGYTRHPGTSVISSRGCVYQCSFCDRSVFKNSFRFNSPEYTFELVKWLKTDFGVKHVMFYDDLFTLNQDRVAKLCRLLRENKLAVPFNCIVRAGHITKELIQELKSSGCWMVNVGIESGDQQILDSYKEGITLESIRQDIEALHNAGIWVKGLFMMGFPGETESSIQKTIEFACSLPLKDANVTAFTPFPGAPVAGNIQEFGSFDSDWKNWSNMDCMKFVFVPKETGSKEELEKYYGEFIRRFYHRQFMKKVYRKMLFQSTHSYWRLIKHASVFWKYAKNSIKIL